VTSEAPRTVLGALDRAASTDLGFRFLERDAGSMTLSFADLRDRAGAAARALADLGVGPGDGVGILGPNSAEWVVWAFATWSRRAAVVPIPFGALVGDVEAYVARLQRSVEAAGCRAVVVDPRFSAAFPDGIARSWELPEGPSEADAVLEPVPEDIAVLQFTSGTTSEPKIAELSHGGVMVCVDGFLDALSVAPGDVSFSWLPFFHDNGLFGHMVGPVAGLVDGVVLPTERFARSPALWFRAATEEGATLTSGPCSAWAVALKAALKNPTGIDLSSLRMGIFGAEAIEPAVIDRFEEHGAEIGLRPGTLVGAYGLAEATLLVTVGRSGGGVRLDRVDLDALADRGVAAAPAGPEARARRIASCGTPSVVYEVRVFGPDGPVPERTIGEIQVAGPGLMNGYRGIEKDRQPITPDGWLETGDAGYLADGELFVTGRVKDIIIVLGRNYSPEEFEWAAQLVPGVRPGRCVAFASVEEAEGRPVVVFELAPGADPHEVAVEVQRSISSALGVALREAVPAVKGTIRKTTSGKLQRSMLRDAYARGEISRATDG
jgi:fatty-acyl-CoA synthase